MANTYTGSCHCGKVRFQAELDLSHVMQCNCSICSRIGWLLAFAPGDKFQLLSGEEVLTDYQFGKKHIHHVFCSNCGVRAFSHGSGREGKPMRAVNVRCLDGVDVAALAIKQVDGKSIPV
jgi:hypothetical protein